MMTDVDDALRRRRERGRKSQAVFRQRLADNHKQMQDQNLRVKTAIEKLVNVTRGNEHPELLNAIFEVAEAVGVNAQRPSQSGPPTLVPTHEIVNSEVSMPFVDGEDDIVINGTTRDFMPKTDSQESFRFDSTAVTSASPHRLKCGIWLDHQHYMRISVPPDDILPYLGPGANTLGGILFWSIMDHAEERCARKHTESAALIRRALLHSKVTEDWAVSYIQAMIEARQEFKSTGSISSQYASAAEPDWGMVMRDRINAEYKARGIDPDRWLSAKGIEKRVKSMVSDGVFALLETAARGEGDPALRCLFENIECTLKETGICFGDGPRWSVDLVDGLFLDWVQKAFWSDLVHDK
ncbi:hypothetical protein F4804DRAFT_84911 [Jackrogersella minutella]|nr:hypothetical protein F4804DRAFT_84911 [Jackrogersella minutella]